MTSLSARRRKPTARKSAARSIVVDELRGEGTRAIVSHSWPPLRSGAVSTRAALGRTLPNRVYGELRISRKARASARARESLGAERGHRGGARAGAGRANRPRGEAAHGSGQAAETPGASARLSPRARRSRACGSRTRWLAVHLSRRRGSPLQRATLSHDRASRPLRTGWSADGRKSLPFLFSSQRLHGAAGVRPSVH